MRAPKSNACFGLVCAVAGVFAASAANAQMASPDEGMDFNVFTLGVGSAPDYMGSSHNDVVPVLAARYEFKGSDRYVLFSGTTLQANLLNDKTWRAGPLVNFRQKRDEEVHDRVVSLMTTIKAKAEFGGFLQYNMKLSDKKMHRVVFATDLAASSHGTVGHLRMTYWQPFTETIVGNIGLGVTYANNKWTDTYFGVFGARNIALYPVELGGQPYNPSSGATGITIPFGLSMRLAKQWMVSTGARYEKLQGDAKDSPVVAARGNDTQWIYGVGLSYLY